MALIAEADHAERLAAHAALLEVDADGMVTCKGCQFIRRINRESSIGRCIAESEEREVMMAARRYCGLKRLRLA